MRTRAQAFLDHIQRIWESCPHYFPAEGCSEEDIDEIAHAQNVVRLPEYYTEFMRIFGKKWNIELSGGEFRYPYVCSFKSLSSWPYTLGINHWFVCLSGDDHLLVFDPEESVDPTLFSIQYSDGGGRIEADHYGRFSDLLIEWANSFCP